MIENNENSPNGDVDHRDHELRHLQKLLANSTLGILSFINGLGILDETDLNDAFENNREIHPDEVTLAGLQLSVRAADEIFLPGKRMSSSINLFLGTLLDGADGIVARKRGLASPEGAMKDVLADRILDILSAVLMDKKINEYSNEDEKINFKDELTLSFQLSTLTKAACEMFGVKTSEGGQGGMVQRRLSLFSLIQNIARLNGNDEKLLIKIETAINKLIDESFESAKIRTEQLAQAIADSDLNYNERLEDSDSGASVEARKYVAIILMMREKFGVDMIPVLNDLVPGFSFPEPEELQQNYGYIENSVDEVQDFIEKAMLIASPSSSNSDKIPQ